VQDAENHNAASLLPIKHDVPAAWRGLSSLQSRESSRLFLMAVRHAPRKSRDDSRLSRLTAGATGENGIPEDAGSGLGDEVRPIFSL